MTLIDDLRPDDLRPEDLSAEQAVTERDAGDGAEDPPTDPTDGDQGGGAVNPPRRRRSWRLIVAVVAVVLLLPVGWSYAGYLTAAGSDPVSVRTVDWLQDHGFESVVNRVEQWYYTKKKPTGATAPAADIGIAAPAASHAVTHVATEVTPTAAIPPHVLPPQPGEGIWQAVTGLATPDGVDQTFIRPDPAYPAVAVNLVRFDQRRTRLVYVPGTKEPAGAPWAWGSEIPTQERSHAIAAFNAGFKFKDTRGGAFTEGREVVRPLADGLASVVIRADGTADVVKWGRDAKMGSDIVTVRQSLSLIVDGGRPVDGLDNSNIALWGSNKSQFQYTARSGLGVDAEGRLIYAAGHQMSLRELADALSDAGAVRAMQLDMHNPVVSFNWYRPDPGSSLGVHATKLMESMNRSATRYLSPEQRDFFTVVTR